MSGTHSGLSFLAASPGSLAGVAGPQAPAVPECHHFEMSPKASGRATACPCWAGGPDPGGSSGSVWGHTWGRQGPTCVRALLHAPVLHLGFPSACVSKRIFGSDCRLLGYQHQGVSQTSRFTEAWLPPWKRPHCLPRKGNDFTGSGTFHKVCHTAVTARAGTTAPSGLGSGFSARQESRGGGCGEVPLPLAVVWPPAGYPTGFPSVGGLEVGLFTFVLVIETGV